MMAPVLSSTTLPESILTTLILEYGCAFVIRCIAGESDDKYNVSVSEVLIVS